MKALHLDRPDRLAGNRLLHEAPGGVGEVDLAGLARLLQPRGQVGIETHGRELHEALRPVVPHVGHAGVDSAADPQRELEAVVPPPLAQKLRLLLHPHRHAHARQGIGRHPVALGSAEDRKDGVTAELRDRAAELSNEVRHVAQVLVEEGGDILRIRGVREAREPVDVGEEQRELGPPVIEGRLHRAGEDLLDDVRVQVARDLPLHLVELLVRARQLLGRVPRPSPRGRGSGRGSSRTGTA